jgi:hypothetical protein
LAFTDGKVHDVNILDQILPEAGAFYVMDRGYVDFERLYIFTLSAAFFVVRTKSNIVLQRRYSQPADKHRSSIRSHCHPHRHRLRQSVRPLRRNDSPTGTATTRTHELSRRHN